MKPCGYCGHQNPDHATRCDECGWRVPTQSTCAKIAKYLRRGAIVMMICLVIAHIVTISQSNAATTAAGEVTAGYSWLIFLLGTGTAALMYWLGDHLRRTH